MIRTYLQQSSTARIRSAHEDDPTKQANMALPVSKIDGARVGKASPFDMALISLPENGPVAAQNFAKFIAQLLPGVSLDIQSGQDGTGTDQQPVLVLANDPILSLAWRIHEGATPDSAFAEWKESAKALLALQRRDRRRILLVDLAILEPRMSLARDVLIRRLEKILPHSAVITPAVPRLQEAGESSHTDMLDPEAFVLAVSLLADQSAADLVQELRAVTIGTIEARDTQELALAAWKKANQARTRTSLLCDQLELQTTRAELDIQRLQDKVELLDKDLKAQLKSSEDSAQVWEAERQDFARQLAERDRQIAAARKEGADARTKLKHLQDKAELLGENLTLQGKLRQELSDEFNALEKRFAQAQEALATEKARAKREREQLIAQKAAVEARRAHAQGRIEALLSSRSWRVTRPLRAITGLALNRS